MRNILEMRWHVVGAPWLPSDTLPYIVAGNEDPHAGIPVVDLMDLEEWDQDTAASIEADPFAVAQHIVDVHNAWLDARDHDGESQDG